MCSESMIWGVGVVQLNSIAGGFGGEWVVW